MTALARAVADAVRAHFLDRSYPATPEWAEVESLLLALPPSDDEDFRAAAQGLLDRLPLSHVALLTPAMVPDAEARSGGAVPDFLRLTGRQGDGWTYVRVPTFTLPSFTAGLSRDRKVVTQR